MADIQIRGAASGGAAVVPDATVPQRMWWMYVLVLFGLAGLGGGAAQALFSTGDLGRIQGPAACLVQHGLSSDPPGMRSSPEEIRQFKACTESFSNSQGVDILVGVLLLPAAAWLLMIGGGLEMRWRLSRERSRPAPTAANRILVDRFEAWCDLWELSGRRRPRLVLVAPGVAGGEAFTTGLPLARPVVVVPVGYAYGNPASFDVVVLHELAHVRSRDLTWASAVWWSGWLSVPVLLAGLVPLLNQVGLVWAFYGASLGLAVALSAATLVLRAALLRRRELAADRHAVAVLDDPEALRDWLRESRKLRETPDGGSGRAGQLPGPLARFGRWVSLGARRAIATHPTPDARANTEPGLVDRWEGGFAPTAATGLVAMFTYHGVHVVLTDLVGFTPSDPGLPSEISLAVASLLWGGLVASSWIRRAKAAELAGSTARWRGPFAGAVLGLLAGFLLQAPGVLGNSDTSVFTGHLPLLALGLTIAAAGVSVLVLGTAVATATGSAQRLVTRTGTVVAASAALVAALSVTLTVARTQVFENSPAQDRLIMANSDANRLTQCVPLLLFAATALAAREQRAASTGFVDARRESAWRFAEVFARTRLALMAGALLAGSLSAVLSWTSRIQSAPTPGDRRYELVYQRYWICAGAGWAVAVIVLLTGWSAVRPASDRRAAVLGRVPAAVSTGLLTAASTGLVQFTVLAVLGYQRNSHQFLESMRMPTWLLLIVLVVTLPWVVLVADMARRIRRAPSVFSNAVPQMLASAVAVAAVAAGLLSGSFAAFTGEPRDLTDGSAASTRARGLLPAPTAATPSRGIPAKPSDPGRPLDAAVANAALASVVPLLPAGYALIANKPTSLPSGIEPKACRDRLTADQATDRALANTADVVKTYTVPAQGTSKSIMTVRLELTSYTSPAPGLSDVDQQPVACAGFTVPVGDSDDGLTHARVSVGSRPRVPHPAYHLDVTGTRRIKAVPYVVVDVVELVRVGHNEVNVSVAYAYLATQPPKATQEYPEKFAEAALASALQQLQAG